MTLHNLIDMYLMIGMIDSMRYMFTESAVDSFNETFEEEIQQYGKFITFAMLVGFWWVFWPRIWSERTNGGE